jgi:hypothetical protein
MALGRGRAVVELVNNWMFSSFEETYRSAALSTRRRTTV